MATSSSSSSSSLHEAARNGDLEAVMAALLSNPLSINDRDRHSRTALHLAAWAGHEPVVKLLCEKNCDVGAAALDDMAAIHFASQKGHIQIARFLLAAGASVNSRTRKGMTPLHYSAQGSHKDLINLLVKRGANVSAENKAGKRPVDLAQDQSIVTLLETASSEQKSSRRFKEQGGLVSRKELDKQQCLEAPNEVGKPVPTVEANEISSLEPLESIEQHNKVPLTREGDEVTETFGPKHKKSKIVLTHLLQESDAEDEVD